MPNNLNLTLICLAGQPLPSFPLHLITNVETQIWNDDASAFPFWQPDGEKENRPSLFLARSMLRITEIESGAAWLLIGQLSVARKTIELPS